MRVILILLIIVGCGADPVLREKEPCDAMIDLEVTAPSLQMDTNGYYHIEWLEGYNQTFSTLSASTGINGSYYQKVWWGSYEGIEYGGEFVMCVNPTSYTDEEGVAHTVLAVWEELIADTITVYALFRDYCEEKHMDSIKVVIDNHYN